VVVPVAGEVPVVVTVVVAVIVSAIFKIVV
jgi:hypothetical protein